MVVGPGDLLAEGNWAPGPDAGEFDAELDVAVTGQALSVLGAVSPDGSQIALYVAASEATSPLDGIPWPRVSRLVGDRVGLVADPTPESDPSARRLPPARLGRCRVGGLGPLLGHGSQESPPPAG